VDHPSGGSAANQKGAMMNGIAHSPAIRSLTAELAASFVEGITWPLDRASLAALLDMGLEPRQIAEYFSVTPADVLELLHKVGMTTRRNQ
jgi:hypothetical protein